MQIHGRPTDLGGFQVRRLLPSRQRQAVGPIVFFDHLGPSSLAAGKGIDVRPHPHIGLSTLTYLFDGSLCHRDSLGVVQEILPGDLNWMTAGSGIVHSERSSASARATDERLHGIQIWVALPESEEERAPSFEHYPKKDLPELSRNGSRARVIVGDLMGMSSPVKTLSPMFYAEVEVDSGGFARFNVNCSEVGVYLVEGSLNGDMKDLKPGSLLTLDGHREINLAATSDARVMVFGGESLGRRHIWWNFVSSDEDKIEKAKERWKSGGFDPVPNDNEFIPLPEK
jgi:hypothetical protein